jgi:hypothetical protein
MDNIRDRNKPGEKLKKLSTQIWNPSLQTESDKASQIIFRTISVAVRLTFRDSNMLRPLRNPPRHVLALEVGGPPVDG